MATAINLKKVWYMISLVVWLPIMLVLFMFIKLLSFILPQYVKIKIENKDEETRY
jgi:hypothetical protein